MQKLLLTILALILFVSTFSQDANSIFKQQIYSYYINEQTQAWEEAVNTKEAITEPTDEQSLFYLTNAYYGLISTYIEAKNEDLAESYLGKAEKRLEQLLAIAPSNQIYRAYEAAFIAFKMEFNPWKIMSLGAKSQEILNLAFETGKDIPEVCYEWANMKFFAPGFAGGNKTEALKYYKRAYQLLEESGATDQWYYLHIKMIYADACVDRDQIGHAKIIYKQLLASEPNFRLAKRKMDAL